ncbi:MAG: LysM peptidoglycan-binding domain-containing protein [Planctomycetota bacterium]|nr:LysM peptidoglycan-binding domain-containing protein [Planctomycetota bacterium]
MSLGFRCFLIVLICFFALWVYHKREGELSIWMGLSQPPPAEAPSGPAPLSGIVGNDTIIETTIKPAPFSNGSRFLVRRNQASRWDRPSIAAAEPESESPRRRSANPSAPAQPGAGVAGETQQAAGVRRETGSLRLVNPSGSEPAPLEEPSVEPGDSVAAPLVPQPLPPPKPRVVYRTHKVKDGDKLWNLAEKYLGKGHRFNQIIELNEALRENPDSLRPGMVLKIPPEK